jgi:hypothetical protein
MVQAMNSELVEARLAELKQSFGHPPVLPDSEDVEAYWKMLRRFIESFAPHDFFETTLMKDVVDGTWEAARWGRHKVLLLDRRYRSRRETEAKRRKEWAAKKAELARRIAASKADPPTEPEDALAHLVEECDAIVLEPASELAHNREIEASLAHLEKLGKLQLMALAKRERALGQLERHRDGIGGQLRLVSDACIAEGANAAASRSQGEASTETAIETAVDAPPVQAR